MHMLIFGLILFLSVVIARPLTDAFYYTKTIDFLRRAAAEAAAATAVDREQAARREAAAARRSEAAAIREAADARRREAAARAQAAARADRADKATRKARETKKTIVKLRAEAPPQRRKPFAELKPQQQRTRIEAAKATISETLGDGFAIIERKTPLTVAEANALRRVYRLPEHTYEALAAATNLPTIGDVRKYERQLVDDCGGIGEGAVNDAEMRWLAQPLLALSGYVEQKRRIEWRGQLPEPLELVVVADKGDSLTKFGVYIATDIAAPQSPANILLLAAYRGNEERALLNVAAGAALHVLNQIIVNVRAGDRRFQRGKRHLQGGANLTLDGEEKFVAIKVLLAVDFKMLSLIVGGKMSLHSLTQPADKRFEYMRDFLEAQAGLLRLYSLDKCA